MISLGAVLGVAIGLALTYALLALIAAAFQETVASFLKLRGRRLRAGFRKLLAGDSTDANAVRLFDSVFGHSAIQSLSPKGLPSYVAAHNFSLALFDTLSDGSQSPVFSQIERTVAALPDCPAKSSITALVKQAGGDLDKLRTTVETWFDDAMDRLSGDYKRFSTYFTLAFAVAVAILFNVDTFTIAKTLWTDPDKRAAIVAIATNYAHEGTAGQTSQAALACKPAKPDQAGQAAAGTDLKAQYQSASDCLDALPIPIGWKQSDTVSGSITATLFDNNGPGFWIVFGWLTTALAVSLGAPFWFDLLQNLINIRGAGPKPARADDPSAVNAA